jgi:hypothetical protein
VNATPTAGDITVAAVPSSTPEPASPPQVAAPAPDVTPATQPAPVPVEARVKAEAETLPAPQPASSPAEATPAAAAEPPSITEAKAPAEAAPVSAPIPPTPIAVGGAPVVPTPPAAVTSEPTRVVAVTATGCEILPTAPGQPGPIPEAARTAAPGTPAPDDKTAKLDTIPAAMVPLPEARPDRKARAASRRSATVKHRRRAPHVRQARREVVRPQPPPDLFTILFGGGIQQQPQQMPATQPAR